MVTTRSREEELSEASCLLPVLGSLSFASCRSLRWQFPPTASLAEPVCLCLFGDARTSCLETSLQRWEFHLCGVFFSKLLSFTMANLFPLFPHPGVAAAAYSCYFMFCFCPFSHLVNSSLCYIVSVKYLVCNSYILAGSYWRQWIQTKSLIMFPTPPQSASQTLPELLNIFP